MKRVTNLFVMRRRSLLRALLIAFLVVLLVGVIGGTVVHWGYYDQARPPVSWCPACRD
ncbi:MAG: hypothetical protein U0350_07300 [Caldilineaceae bacterium]